jgi:hypothetical protein
LIRKGRLGLRRIGAPAPPKSSACENETIILFSVKNGICNLIAIAQPATGTDHHDRQTRARREQDSPE